MDLYFPALPRVAADLAASTSATQLTLSLYLVGLALGQIVFGRLSDLRGRRPALLGGLLVFVAASGLCATATSTLVLTGGRLFQGLGGASGMVISRVIVRDIYDVRTSARYYSRLTLIYGLAPILAPSIGAQILRVTSWHGIFLTLAGIGSIALAGAFLWLPETWRPDRRGCRSRPTAGKTFLLLLRDTRFVGCGLTLGFASSALIAYSASAAFVMEDGYGVSPEVFALLFGANALALVIGNQLNAHLLHRFSPANLAATGLAILLLATSGVVVVAISGLGLPAFEGCLVCLVGSLGFIPSNILALGLGGQAAVAGAASALLGFAQYGMSSLVAPLVGLAGDRSQIPFAIVALACGMAASAAAYFLVFGKSDMMRESGVAT
jgi:DHA1 family bicyclomycin/chloramphenicol resistance-like MFS transporter